MPLLCREKEYSLLQKLLGGEFSESRISKPPPLIFVQGGPQTGKKCLVSSVLKSIDIRSRSHKQTKDKLKIRSALLSCHIGSFGSSALFEELWRQLISQNLVQPGNEYRNYENLEPM